MMHVLLALTILGQSVPGPLDAFRANFASIRADVDYTYEFGSADPKTLEDDRIWRGEIVGFREMRNHAVRGRWSFDGVTERYEARAPEDVLREYRKHERGETREFYVEPFELVFDGRTAAYHRIKAETVDPRSHLLIVHQTHSPGWLGFIGGPFYWFERERFPILLETEEFANARVERTQGVRAGSMTDVEIWKDPRRHRQEIAIWYDPGLGYLPKYIRLHGVMDSTGEAAVREMFLIDAKPCAAGGFVPMEWYEANYLVDRLESRYPTRDHNTVFRPTSGEIRLGHYKAIRMTNRSTPVALEKLAGITHITPANGFSIPLKATPSRMTLDEAISRLGPRLTEVTATKGPTLDMEEIAQYEPQEAGSRNWYPWVAALLACLGILLLVRRRRSLAALAAVFLLPGCGRDVGEAIPRLTAEVSPARSIYDPDSPLIDLKLILTNRGTRPLRVLDASGGCFCRKVEKSVLPADVKPGSRIALNVRLTGDRSFEPRTFVLACATDRGLVECPVEYLALPRHSFNPESINLGVLSEGKDVSFEVVHHEVYRANEARPETRIKFPRTFRASKGRTSAGRVKGAEEFSAVETRYHLSLADDQFGLKKEQVKILGKDDRLILEAPIGWQRVSFLSSVPEKVYLGTRPTRVFLRCPDESIELTRVLSAPVGVKAVVSSSREVTVMPEKTDEKVTSGTIEVGTTARDRPPLRIPVVYLATLSAAK